MFCFVFSPITNLRKFRTCNVIQQIKKSGLRVFNYVAFWALWCALFISKKESCSNPRFSILSHRSFVSLSLINQTRTPFFVNCIFHTYQDYARIKRNFLTPPKLAVSIKWYCNRYGQHFSFFKWITFSTTFWFWEFKIFNWQERLPEH